MTSCSKVRALLAGLLVTNIGWAADVLITSPAPAENYYFGWSLAVDAGRVLVGEAPWRSSAFTIAGSVYLLDAQTGASLATFANPDPALETAFGISIDIDGGLILIGSQCCTNTGRAYVFDAVSGALLHTLTTPAADEISYFGEPVSLRGSLALVGATREPSGGYANAGRAYLFDATTGSVLQTFENPEPDQRTLFGLAVAVGDGVALIADSSVVHVFDTSDGSLLNSFAKPDTQDGAFGRVIAISGSRALITSRGSSAWPGRVYVMDYMSGTLLHTLENPTPDAGDNFGDGLDVDGNIAIIGAYGDGTTATAAGRAYIFDIESGTLIATIDNPSPDSAKDWFGKAVGIADGHVYSGAPRQDTPVFDAGVVWGIDLNDTVPIDIVPYDSANEVFPASDVAIPVAVVSQSTALGDPLDFDALTTDPDSLEFGPGEAPVLSSNPFVDDVNSDGLSDAVYSFSTQASGIACNDTEASLRGVTTGGQFFEGSDTVDASDCETTCH